MYFRCTMWWFDTGTHCEKMTTFKLINASINSHSYVFLERGVVSTFRIYSVSKFQVHNLVLLTYYWPETEKAMAPHSSTLAWKIPWTEEPGGRQSMGSLRVGHNWGTSLSLFTFMHWRRKWQPTPVFLPGGSQGRGSLMGCRLWGRTESDTTEAT